MYEKINNDNVYWKQRVKTKSKGFKVTMGKLFSLYKWNIIVSFYNVIITYLSQTFFLSVYIKNVNIVCFSWQLFEFVKYLLIIYFDKELY